MSPAPHNRAGLVPGQVRGDLEEPRTGPPGLGSECPDEGLLREITGPFRIPHLAVQEPDEIREGRAVHLRPVDAHGAPG
jgi:hypothetical protein